MYKDIFGEEQYTQVLSPENVASNDGRNQRAIYGTDYNQAT